jgi:nucleoid DNA-binding protein
MTKKDLIDEVAKTTRLTHVDSSDAVKSTIKIIIAALKRGEKVVITGFGTFRVNHRAERRGRNPKTGEAITLPAHKSVHFIQGKTLKGTIR